jgi:preprotein translocase subunit SecG
MVSNKVILVLIIIAILLFVISIIVTISHANLNKVPEISQKDPSNTAQVARIGLVINPPSKNT